MDALLDLPAIYLLSIDTPPGVQQKTELLAPSGIESEILRIRRRLILPKLEKMRQPRFKMGPLAVRFRVWRLVPREHQIFRERYTEWS